MMIRKDPLLIVLTAVVCGSLAYAQQTTPPPQQPTTQRPEDIDVVRITTNLVQVDAVVTDSKGQAVRDLKQEELEIFEDGRKQKITHFSFIGSESHAPTTVESATKPGPIDKNAPPIPPARLKVEDVRRTIAIVVDDLGLSFESTYYVRRALKKFVDQQMEPGDLVAIIRSSGGMGALQSFTADKRQLYAAIDHVKWYSSGRSGIAAFAPMEAPTAGPGGADMDAMKAEQEDFRKEIFSVGTLGAVSYVIRGMHELPGRKSILLISDGFKITARETPDRTMGLQRPTNVDRTLLALQSLIDQASRASVVIYTMNATGLQTLGLTAADETGGRSMDELNQALDQRRLEAFDNQSGLDYLAQNTGGIAIKNNNDLAGGIRKIIADQRSYYLIGYRPDESTFDPRTGRRRFHHISLKVTRPGKFSVRMRKGFYGVSEEETTVQRSLGQTLFEALASPFGATGVHLQLTSLFANDAKAGSFMRSVLHIDARDLTFVDQPDKLHRAIFDIMAITFGDNGLPVDQIARTYTVDLPDELYKRAQRDGLVYNVTVPIRKAGAYQLRLSLRDTASERIGSAGQFVDVPDLKKNRLALSGIALRGHLPQSTSVQKSNVSAGATLPASNTGATNPENEGLEKGNAEASPAVRHFHQGMVMEYAFYIYNVRTNKTTNSPQLATQVRLVRDGKVVFNGKENPMNTNGQTDLTRLIAGGAIALGTDLAPGEYVFQVIVTDALANEKHRTATQWMDFEIIK